MVGNPEVTTPLVLTSELPVLRSRWMASGLRGSRRFPHYLPCGECGYNPVNHAPRNKNGDAGGGNSRLRRSVQPLYWSKTRLFAKLVRAAEANWPVLGEGDDDNYR